MKATGRYQELVSTFSSAPNVVMPEQSRGFGSGALRVEGKIFAMLVRERLVVKLPKERVDDLVTAGVGVRFDAHKGRPMKEWFSLDPISDLDWALLAGEALAFVSRT